MTEESMGASPNGVGLSSASPIEPVPVSPVPASIPCAWQVQDALEEAVYALRNIAGVSVWHQKFGCPSNVIADDNFICWVENWSLNPAVEFFAARDDLSAKAIEARRAETGTGSVEDESAVPAGHSPEPSIPSTTTKEVGE